MDSKLKCVFDYVEDSEAKHVENVGANVSGVVNIIPCSIIVFTMFKSSWQVLTVLHVYHNTPSLIGVMITRGYLVEDDA